MNDSANSVLECPLKSCWVSFRLVSENAEGASFAGLLFTLRDTSGAEFYGELDADGYARVAEVACGPLVLSFEQEYLGGDDCYDNLIDRPSFRLPLTKLQVAAEEEASGPRNSSGETYLARNRAEREQAIFYRVEVSDFVTAKAHLPDVDSTWKPRPSALLKANSGAAAPQVGVALKPNQHHVLEVKALRALSPLLSRGAKFTALNAYQLAVMSAFVYAPFSKEADGEYQSAHAPVSS